MVESNQDIAEYLSTADDVEQAILNLDPNSHLARTALEYAINNSMTNVLDELIEKLLTSDNEESQSWAEVYRIDREVVKGNLSLIEATNKLTYMKSEAKELNALRKIFQLYNYHDLKYFEMVSTLSELVQAEIEELVNGYIKKSLISRLGLVMQAVYLHLNDLEKCRNYGNIILDNAVTEKARGVALRNIANSYTLINYDIAIMYFNESKALFQKLGQHVELTNSQRSLNFAHCYWNKQENFSRTSPYNAPEEIQGYAYYLIKNKEYTQAEKLLEQLQTNITNNFQLGFQYYYKGLIKNCEDYFLESVTHFKKAGDYYYRNLPLIELKKIGVNNVVLDALRV
ncbi:AimR family lysis-lysogeny pheromone receptor [Alkalihalobacterium chitinilyticum]|uniref:AimR family lysis-lysogeny pheromone receptor n=1 Tax=Alkalihalobacterium chitinilyticum TaxID=2980103 RepID=A0ABT5VIZ7_9BACI|nr:AimR family lysis-lysogeny pheromone receptor [Alkalihalobacterium chitinilyticum]MDE5415431.1 AimR family lysis-lysogeny pheromone receptor [Alkalihalobacterium chitinilyticum]